MSNLPIECLDPTKPVAAVCNTTNIFGVPKNKLGRQLPTAPLIPIPISGIALHCVQDTFDGYLAKACVGGTRMAVDCHASFHYVIDAETGQLSSLVPEADIAWSWQSYRSNFPITTPLDCCQCPTPCPQLPCPADQCVPAVYTGWPVLSGLFPNISADFYTINIGITNISRPEQSALDGVNCCLGPYGFSPAAYKKLIQLLAWIEFRYDAITLDAQHIKFHDEIVERTDSSCLECGCGSNGACLVCDISAYCERCPFVSDPTYSESTTVRYVYGENASGCRVKILLTDLKAALALLP
jgi:hypothetical protein